MVLAAQVHALRGDGLSYAEIGDQLGITKDAARGTHTRWLARGGVDEPPSLDDGVRAPAVPDAVPNVNFSIGYFDLEASGLNGSFGRLFTAACAHSLDGDEWGARIDDRAYFNRRQKSDDSKLAVAIRDHLESHDIIVSWNGKRGMNSKGRSGFDVPMLNARLMQPDCNERILRPILHIDLLKEIRKHIELHSFRLQAVEEFLELSEEKTRILPRYWNRALDGDKGALDYIFEHNVKDVRVLRLVFESMRSLDMLRKPTW